MDSIGLIGVGLLGSAIAARLSAAGYPVLGYDIVPERRLGAGTAQQVASGCRVIILCLPTSDVVAQVLGEIELAAGATVIDCTTGEPETMAALGAKLARSGIDYLDATVLGSSRVVRSGSAVAVKPVRTQAWPPLATVIPTGRFVCRRFVTADLRAAANVRLATSR